MKEIHWTQYKMLKVLFVYFNNFYMWISSVLRIFWNQCFLCDQIAWFFNPHWCNCYRQQLLGCVTDIFHATIGKRCGVSVTTNMLHNFWCEIDYSLGVLTKGTTYHTNKQTKSIKYANRTLNFFLYCVHTVSFYRFLLQMYCDL